jgi:hypothetical protein
MLGNGNAIRRTGIRDRGIQKREIPLFAVFLEIGMGEIQQGIGTYGTYGITGTGHGLRAELAGAKRTVLGIFSDSAGRHS